MTNPTHAPTVEVRQSPYHGRGLFASVPFGAGEVIGTYPLLVLSASDTAALRDTRLYHYVFHVDEDDTGAMRAAIAFGAISMCNHSSDANADFVVDAEAQTVTLTSRTAIPAGTEILIDYEEFADVAV